MSSEAFDVIESGALNFWINAKLTLIIIAGNT